MKLSTVFLALGLALPAISHAANVKLTDTRSFDLTALSDVSVGYSWDDLIYSVTTVKKGVSTTNTSIVDAKGRELSWELASAAFKHPLHGSIADPANASSGGGTLPFWSLAAGSYTLTLDASWNYPSLGKPGTTVDQKAFVSLAPPAIHVIGASNPPPIPEPDTYAMLIAGLGLMGAVARRRNSRP